MKFHLLCILILTSLFSTSLWASKNSDQVSRYLQQASEQYNKKKYFQAEKAFQKVLQMKVPLHDEFYYFYAVTQVKSNQKLWQ